MTAERHPIREEDLIAYADGRLGADRRGEVESWLRDHPNDAARVDAWRHQNEAIRTAFGPVAAEPLPARLDVRRMAAARRAGSGRRYAMAAAAVVLLVLGAAGGWMGRGVFAPPAGSVSLIAEALDAHRLYASEVVHPVEVKSDDEAHLSSWLSKRLGIVLVIPDLSADGFRLIGGRLLPAGGQAAAQYMYENDEGQRITLFIVPAGKESRSAFRYASSDKLEALFWSNDKIACAIVGDLPRDALKDIATRAYKQFG
ncbi:MAG: anti-sigma factor [Rhodobiaceae bacterium]|nr:anti-sigma factor [Rhodobiaceae bacterium]MCC0056014.1 anti-sigma factor [Rhodobiaceae bacterium]